MSVTCDPCFNHRHVRCERKGSCGCVDCGGKGYRTIAPLEAPSAPRKPSTGRGRGPGFLPGHAPIEGAGRPSKLTADQMVEVRNLVAAGELTISDIARQFGIARKTVHRIRDHEYKVVRK